MGFKNNLNFFVLFLTLCMTPKNEIIMVVSNYWFFHYGDSNIGLFSIASCKVIALNLLFCIFCIISLLLCLISLSIVCDSDSCRSSFLLLKAIAIAFKSETRVTTVDIAIVGRAITFWEIITKKI